MLRRFLARQFALPSGWAGRWLIAPWLDRISAPHLDLVLRELDPQRYEEVLEVGFGGGEALRRIAACSARVTGVDPSPDLVRRARRRFRADRAVRIEEGRAERLPCPDRAFDKACSLHNVYFWSDARLGLSELARVLRPGGRFVLGFEPAESMRRWPGHVHGFRLQDPGRLARQMEEAGFEAVRRSGERDRRGRLFCCLTGERIGAEGKHDRRR